MKDLNTLRKIGIIGTQAIGKTTLIEDMMRKWPQLHKPEKSYRELIKEKNLKINKEGNKESQDAIMGALVEQSLYNYGNKKVIFDRTPLDCLVYSLWLYSKGLGGIDEKFMESQRIQVREAMKFYSVIFYIPLVEENDCIVTEKENRDVDLEYRKEIANYFEIIYRGWESGGSAVFDPKDSAAIIPVYGNRQERIAMISLYLNENCEFYGEEDSLIKPDIEDIQKYNK